MPQVPATDRFDVFVSYNSDDARVAVSLAEKLKRSGLQVWLDKWELRPGLSWQQGMAEGIASSSSCAVLIGKGGFGAWHQREVEVALQKQGGDYPVIPVLLPGGPDRTADRGFLSTLTWVDFHRGLDDGEAVARLIWGITGVRPAEYMAEGAADDGCFHIESVRDGDLLSESTPVSGAGPANEEGQLYCRAPGDDENGVVVPVRTDEAGRWSLSGAAVLRWGEGDGYATGPYELYVADSSGGCASQPVTVFHGDTRGIHKAVATLRAENDEMELSYALRTAFLERTKLQADKLVSSGKASGPITDVERLAGEVARDAAAALRRLVPRDDLQVSVTIDPAGRISLDPEGAWASYYAFPVPADASMFGFPPSSRPRDLEAMQMTQLAWRLTSHVGQIPANPFAGAFEATSSYLEIRHDGYRPEFVSLEGQSPQSFHVVLAPVLEKRIAVLEFPALDPKTSVPGLSQLIEREVLAAIESDPALAPFGYFSPEAPKEDSPDFFEQLGRPELVVSNELLGLEDVRDLEARLAEFDTPLVSGEGRFAQRKAFDIQFVVEGSYRVFSN
jgi:hypothetical protein